MPWILRSGTSRTGRLPVSALPMTPPTVKNTTAFGKMPMRDLPKDLREMHIVGRATPEKVISAKVSPLMDSLHIGLAGVSDAGRGFVMARHKPPYGHVLACFAGEGEVMID